MDDDVVGFVAGGDETFLAVDDEAVAAPPVGAGLNEADIGARFRLVTATQARRSPRQLGTR